MTIWTEKPAITTIFLKKVKEKEKVVKAKERVINAMDVPSLLAEKAKAKAKAKINPHLHLLGRTDCQMEQEFADFI